MISWGGKSKKKRRRLQAVSFRYTAVKLSTRQGPFSWGPPPYVIFPFHYVNLRDVASSGWMKLERETVDLNHDGNRNLTKRRLSTHRDMCGQC